MPFKWWFKFGLTLVIVVTSGAGPAGGNDRLRFGVLPVVDTLPLLVGQSEGHFAAEGINLELVAFQSALERDAALQAGKLDGYFGDILNTVLLIQAGQHIGIITTVFHTHAEHRMFGIATAPGSGIRSVAALENRAVAISRATVIEYLLDRLTAQKGLPAGFVEKLEIKKMPVRLQMLLADQVPAALLPEPLLTLAESKGAAVVLDDRILDTSETVLALKIHEETKPLAARFLKAYAAAVERINRKPERYKTLLIEKTRFPMPVKNRYRIPVFPAVGVPSEADVTAVQDWLVENGMMTERLDYGAIVYTP